MKKLSLLLVGAIALSCSSSDQTPDAYGNLEATEVFVSAEVGGKIIQSSIQEGGLLEENQIILTVDTTQLYLKKGQTEAMISALRDKLQNIPIQLEVYQKKEQLLRYEVQRVKNLLEAGAATQKQLDDLSGELEVVTRQSEALESQLSTANRSILAEIKPLNWQLLQLEDQIARSAIKSPINGTVLQKFKEPGEMVMPGQPVAKLANLKTLEARVFITGDQLSAIKLGGQAKVSVDGAEGSINYDGTITWISDRAEFTPKSIQTKAERVNLVYAVKLEMKNDGRLKIGMPVDVTFTL
ncbi:HlyD family secretion protein [Marinoscillum sp.]|uniref:HlyD family secretion protein n=1 Tax=Marinoscillum sp. TaxID=2024838 RepID=UPI003BAB4E7F